MGGPLSAAQIVAAVEHVGTCVRRSRRDELQSHTKIQDALTRIAQITRQEGAQTAAAALAAIRQALLAPVDPSEIEWNVFRLFELEESETDWTLWLAAALSPESGEALSRLMWRALCGAISSRSTAATPCDEAHRIATLEAWHSARDTVLVRGAVQREKRHHGDYGQIDIAIDGPTLYVMLENKLYEGWHDGAGEPQAVRYRKFGLELCGRAQSLGLVLLTADPEFELDDRCRDYVLITYRDLALALRRELRDSLHPASAPREVFALWPALLTVAAIERILLQLDLQRVVRAGASWRNIRDLDELADYLIEAHPT